MKQEKKRCEYNCNKKTFYTVWKDNELHYACEEHYFKNRVPQGVEAWERGLIHLP